MLRFKTFFSLIRHTFKEEAQKVISINIRSNCGGFSFHKKSNKEKKNEKKKKKAISIQFLSKVIVLVSPQQFKTNFKYVNKLLCIYKFR